MSDNFAKLGAIIANADISAEPERIQNTVDQAIRASLLCMFLGAEREQWVWPFPALNRKHDTAPNQMVNRLAELFEPLDGIGHVTTLGGASDLDPVDPGPSHTVLPATAAACTAHRLLITYDESIEASNREVGSAVLAGIEAAWRFRSTLVKTRPGVGFHSPGVFGALAAAGSGARMLSLTPNQCIDAVAIALTRAAGLGVNSAASMIGMTHFGWGAVHGLEAALLASQGWTASHDFQRGLATLFGGDQILLDRLSTAKVKASEALVFKRYPCNIYLNLVAAILGEAQPEPTDQIEVHLPWVPHLDCPKPRDLRQARNSAQAVAAIAGASGLSYAAFSGGPGPWVPTPEVAQLLPNVLLKMNEDAPTNLNDAEVGIKVWRGSSLIFESRRAMRSLQGWGAEHAHKLVGPGEAGNQAVQALYNDSYHRGFDYVKRCADSPNPPSNRSD